MENVKRKAEIDPEYEDTLNIPAKRARLNEENDLNKKYAVLVQVIKREFHNEISSKEKEVHKIQQRLFKAQKTLHLLKYAIIKSFYDRKELKISSSDESFIQTDSSTNYNEYHMIGQNRLHPAVKKLVGKKPINYESYRTRVQKNAKLTSNIKVEHIKEENDADIKRNRVIFDILEPDKELSDSKLEEKLIRNRHKTKHRIIIGNISKWIPSSSSQDKSTHKWMIYVRGPKETPNISHIIKKVRFFLHPSYQPNDIVELEEPPFHLSRRGWGEFPLRVQLHFHFTGNKPVDIIHNLKLDRAYTGRQTLGNETNVDLWLYDSNIYEEFSDKQTQSTPLEDIKEEPSGVFYKAEDENFELISENTVDNVTESSINTHTKNTDNNVSENTNLDHTEYCIKHEKNVESFPVQTEVFESVDGTVSIHAQTSENMEIDDDINQEVIEDVVYDNCYLNIPIENGLIRQKPKDKYLSKKNGQLYRISQPERTQISLLKRMFKKKLQNVNKIDLSSSCSKQEQNCDATDVRDDELIYLEDHCYTNKSPETVTNNEFADDDDDMYDEIIEEQELYKVDKVKYSIILPTEKFSSVSQVVYYLFKTLPLVTELANDFNYTCCYPYVAANWNDYLSWTHAKRCCAEWFRAKHIKNMLSTYNIPGHEDWTVKIILMYGRAHAFTPFANYDIFKSKNESGKTIPNQPKHPEVTSTFTEHVSIESLMKNKRLTVKEEEEECLVDIENEEPEKQDKKKSNGEKVENPVEIEENLILPCAFVKQTAQMIGVKFEPEEIIPKVWHNSSERVLLQAVKCLAEELMRKAWANNIIRNKGRYSDTVVDKNEIFNVLLERPEFDMFLNVGLGKTSTCN